MVAVPRKAVGMMLGAKRRGSEGFLGPAEGHQWREEDLCGSWRWGTGSVGVSPTWG